jgi:hypothetical protein
MLPLNIDLSIGNDEQKEDYRLSRVGDSEYAVYLNTEQPLFNIKRADNLKWVQAVGEPVSQSIVDMLGEDLNYIDEQEFEFPLVYEGEGILCRVAIGESGFGVLINNKLIAEVNLNDKGTGGKWSPAIRWIMSCLKKSAGRLKSTRDKINPCYNR